MAIDIGAMERDDDTIAGRSADDASEQVESLVELVEAQRATIESLRAAIGGHQERSQGRSQARRVFAHEVATPITAILGLLELLSEGGLAADDQAAIVERATRQAGHLRQTVEDVLDAPAEELVPIRRAAMSVVAVRDLVQDVLDGVNGGFDDGTIDTDVPADLRVATVPSRVRQILVNLVVNARRHGGRADPVLVTAARLDGAVVLEVADRGPGIPADLVDALFEPFVQGPGATARGGAGLGLYLVRSLAASLGGSVTLEPPDGGGTVARVVLPQQRDADQDAAVIGEDD